MEERRTPSHARRDATGAVLPRGLAERPTAPLPVVGNVGEVVAYALPETTLTGLRTFDLGNVPASVTPPRSWRRAAWFAVGTSTAVMTGLAAAAVAFMGQPEPANTVIDALPAYPTRQIEIDELPGEASSSAAESSKRNSTTPTDTRHDTVVRPDDPTSSGSAQPGTSSGSTGGTTSDEDPSTVAPPPVRETVGEAPVTPTDPQAMGDRTEQFYQLVTQNPDAAHAMTTGGMRAEGSAGIEARYAGVARVEVQQVTIDRGQAVTTSTVKIVHTDGSETVETRRLTFTWGGDPKITDEAAG